MQQKPASATSETYKLQMNIFENGQPEELIFLLENFKKAIGGTITTTISIRSNCLRTIIYGETLQEFENMTIQNNGTTNTYLEVIQERLLMYPHPPKQSLKTEARNVLRHTETPHGAFKDIFGKAHQDQQPPTAIPWVIQEQEYGQIGSQQDYAPCRPQ